MPLETKYRWLIRTGSFPYVPDEREIERERRHFTVYIMSWEGTIVIIPVVESGNVKLARFTLFVLRYSNHEKRAARYSSK